MYIHKDTARGLFVLLYKKNFYLNLVLVEDDHIAGGVPNHTEGPLQASTH
jgi:hypothetical protein